MYLSLLVFIFINYYYYIKHWIKKDYTLLYLYKKMNNAKDVDIKNRTCHYFDDIININNHDLDFI